MAACPEAPERLNAQRERQSAAMNMSRCCGTTTSHQPTFFGSACQEQHVPCLDDLCSVPINLEDLGTRGCRCKTIINDSSSNDSEHQAPKHRRRFWQGDPNFSWLL